MAMSRLWSAAPWRATGATLVALGAIAVHGACSSESSTTPEPEVGGPTVHPGQPCLSCHSVGSSSAASAFPFTLGGTVFVDLEGTQPVEGATITVTGADQAVLELTTNEAGNFYSTEAVQLPAMTTVTLGADTLSMLLATGTGDCNSCHIPATLTGGIHVP